MVVPCTRDIRSSKVVISIVEGMSTWVSTLGAGGAIGSSGGVYFGTYPYPFGGAATSLVTGLFLFELILILW